MHFRNVRMNAFSNGHFTTNNNSVTAAADADVNDNITSQSIVVRCP